MKIKVLLLSIFLYSFSAPTFSQFGPMSQFDPNGTIRNQLSLQIKQQLGPNYSFSYFILNSMLYKFSIYGELADPYGTLKNKVLFTAYPAYNGDSTSDEGNYYTRPDSTVIGFWGNGTILWISQPICITNTDTSVFGQNYNYGCSGEIMTTADINLDGRVDIILMVGGYYVTNLWIISWDGTNGEIINDIDPINRTTKLIGKYYFHLIDPNDNEIKEILTYWPPNEDTTATAFKYPQVNISTLPYVSYGWNGSKYGLWNNTVQVGLNQFLPANRLSGSVNCIINKDPNSDSLIYSYSVSSQNISKQRIGDFYLEKMTESKKIFSPERWWVVGGFDSSGINWTSFWSQISVHPGATVSGFLVKSLIIPAIIQYHLRGEVQTVAFGPDLDIYNYSDIANDIRTNSITGYTIAPVDTPSPFVPLNFLDTLLNFEQQSLNLGWIRNQSTANKYTTYFDTAISQLQQNNIAGARNTLNNVLNNVNLDSSSNLTSEAYALIRYNTEYLLTKLPNSCLAVKLVNSSNINITTGSLQYYDSTWQNAVNNNDGTFLVNTPRKKVNLKMTYANCSQTLSNVTVGNDTVIFKTVNSSVQLMDSHGNPLDTGTVQYYAGAWQNFGTTANGIANMELLPNSYKFRMTYANASIDTQQNIGINPNVVFQTVNTAVQLKNSLGTPIDTGTVQYYAGAWRSFGNSANGIVNKELLPNSYKFRMTYDYVSEDTTQNIGISNTVNFSTVLCTISVKDSLGRAVNNADTKYYAGAWREIGLTSGGTAAKELLPVSLQFRVKSGKTQQDITQDLSVNNLVQFVLP